MTVTGQQLSRVEPVILTRRVSSKQKMERLMSADRKPPKFVRYADTELHISEGFSPEIEEFMRGTGNRHSSFITQAFRQFFTRLFDNIFEVNVLFGNIKHSWANHVQALGGDIAVVYNGEGFRKGIGRVR